LADRVAAASVLPEAIRAAVEDTTGAAEAEVPVVEAAGLTAAATAEAMDGGKDRNRTNKIQS
jgi:hypothetical protein